MMSQKLKIDEPEVENVSAGRKMEARLLRMIVASCLRGILVMELVGGLQGPRRQVGWKMALLLARFGPILAENRSKWTIFEYFFTVLVSWVARYCVALLLGWLLHGF